MESLEVCLTLQEELKALLFDGSSLEKDDASLFNFISSLENPGVVLDYCISFKDEGNSSFKGGVFEEALEKYGLSCVFLSCLGLEDAGVRASFLQLATSVVLNMAASLLKKKEYKQVGHLCSIILNYNPNNIKALFRRANAAIGLGKFELASWDLRLAHEVEPTNKEVLRKLREVEDLIRTPSDKIQGKRKAKQLECDPEGSSNDKREKVLDTTPTKSKKNNCNTRGLDDIKLFAGTEHLAMQGVDHDIAMGPENTDKRFSEEEDRNSGNTVTKDERMSEKVEDTGFGEKESEIGMDKEMLRFHFRNKKKSGATLVISEREYHLLAKGRMVQHFNPKSGITMSIKVIGAPKENDRSHSQSSPHPSPLQQEELNYHRLSTKNVTLSSTDLVIGNTLNPPLPDPSDVRTPFEDTLTLPNNPSQMSSPKQNSTFLQSSATGTCSFPFQSTTVIRSPSRRASYQTPKQGVKKNNRVNNGKRSCGYTNHVFHRCKVAVEASDSVHLHPRSQSHTNFRFGKKRKSSFLQNSDTPSQPRKFFIIANVCNCVSNHVSRFSSHVGFGNSLPSWACNVTSAVINAKLAKTSAIG